VGGKGPWSSYANYTRKRFCQTAFRIIYPIRGAGGRWGQSLADTHLLITIHGKGIWRLARAAAGGGTWFRWKCVVTCYGDGIVQVGRQAMRILCVTFVYRIVRDDHLGSGRGTANDCGFLWPSQLASRQ